MSAEYNFRFRIDWNVPRFDLDLTAGYIGAVKVLGIPVAGQITQAQINAALEAYVEEHPGALLGLTDELKQALLQIAAKIAYVDDQGQSYYDDLYDALYPAVTLTGITATYTQTETVYTTDALNVLISDLVVTANYSDGTSETIASTDYTLSGTLTAGTSTITVTYSDMTATFSVNVTTGYVTDGLLAYWDGIKNTGTEHNSSATSWKDVTNGYEFTFQNSNGRTWNANNLELSSGHRGLKTASRLWSTYENCTIEYVIAPASVRSEVLGMFDPNSTASTMPSGTEARECVLYSDNTIGFKASSGKTYSMPAGVSDITGIRRAVAIYSNYTVSSAYVNGTELSLSGNTHSYGQFGPNNFRLGEWTNTSGQNTAPYYGKIYAVRVYGKALSAEELAQNNAFDNAYYGLGS